LRRIARRFGIAGSDVPDLPAAGEAIEKEILDELLKDKDPKTMFS
jgi:hypothetical protein